MRGEIPTLEVNPSSPAKNTNQFRFVMDVVLRHWVSVALLTILGLVAGAAVGIYLRDDRYEFEAYGDLTITPSLWNSPLMADLGGAHFAALTPVVLKEQTNLPQLAEDVAEALVREDIQEGGALSVVVSLPELDEAAADIEQAIYLEPLPEAHVLRVRARGEDSAQAQRRAEFAVRALIDHTRLRMVEAQEEAYTVVRSQLNDLRSELDRAESLQWDYRERMGFQTSDQVWASMEQRNQELLQTKTQIEETQAKLLEVQGSLEENSERLPDSLGNVTDNVVQELMGELDELRRQQVEMNVVWQPEYPGLVAVEDQINEKKQAIMMAIGEMNSSSSSGGNLWSQRQDLYRQKVDLELELTGLEIRAASAERMLKEQVERLPELADKNFQYDQLSHETEQVRTQFKKMLEKEFEIRTALDRGTAKIERRDAVVVNSYFAGRGSPVLASSMLGALIGFVFAFAYFMMREINDTSIKDLEDAQEALGLEVIGMIPSMRFGKPGALSSRGVHYVATDEEQVDACIVTQHDPKSPISEAYRSFRTNFQFATIQHQPKTVLITSAVPGEGKTTTAVNFAVTMADRGMRVLIVDTDLRRPNVHRVLKMERGPGLADVLRERIPIKNVIRPTRTENLYIISSGRVPPNPSELIGSERMKRLMQELGEAFDLVVCDAPSVLVVTDPVLLATHVDSVVMVLSVSRVRRETAQRAKKLLETANPNIAGVVLNGLETSRRHYYYYYYYYDDQNMGRRGRPYLTS